MQNALPEELVGQDRVAGTNPQIDSGHGGEQDQRQSEIFEAAVELGADVDQGKEKAGGQQERANDLE